MQSPRALTLPLSLAALLLATGCVTVRPAAPPDVPASPLPQGRTQPAAEGLPLGRLPSVPSDEPTAREAAQEAAEGAAPEAAAAVRPSPAPAHRPRRGAGVERARPARPVPPPRPRPPAAPKPRPAPQRTYDMAALCEAAKGTVSPAIVALCR